MRLVRLQADGVWVQLEGETPVQWQALETLAHQGERTSGAEVDSIGRIAGRHGSPGV